MTRKRIHETAGPSTRQLRVGEVLRRTLSELLIRGAIHDPDLGRMSITVGEVRITADLRIATVYVLPLGGGHRDEAIAALARNAGEIRHQIGKATGFKHTPELRFVIDTAYDQMDETRALLERDAVKRDLEGE